MTGRTLTNRDCAEQAGAAIAEVCLNAILEAALLDLRHLPHPKRAAGGFTTMLVNVIESGLGVAK